MSQLGVKYVRYSTGRKRGRLTVMNRHDLANVQQIELLREALGNLLPSSEDDPIGCVSTDVNVPRRNVQAQQGHEHAQSGLK